MSEYKKHKESCVDINIYVDCHKKEYKKESHEEKSYKNDYKEYYNNDYKNDYYEDNYYNKDYKNNYKEEHHEEHYTNKKHPKDDFNCVKVNVFAKCNKCKHERIKHLDRYEEKY